MKVGCIVDAQFYPKRCELVISFDPRESDSSSLLMRLVWEEEWQKGTLVPDLNDDFFRKFATSREKFRIKFSYEYLEFVIAFLEETYKQWESDDINVSVLENFLCEISDYCPACHTIQ